ncbi:transposase (fragment) [Legionella fallonii LLAP-10]|uniref:Transposase n=1 Tax=Legionella fallonii LLAP-10 TaxID=1212491 RepID=A0A098G3M0_9GAMM
MRASSGIDLQTAVRSNMKGNRGDYFLQWLTSTKRPVEIVIGQLTDRFQIEKIRARKLWYLTNRITRKVLAHTVCAFINKKRVTQFELLVKP